MKYKVKRENGGRGGLVMRRYLGHGV